MPTLEVEKTKTSKNPKIKMILVVLAVLVLAGGLWWLWTWRVAEDKWAYEAAVANQKIAGLKSDYAGAIEGWESYQNRLWPRNYDYEAILNQAGLYQTMRQNTEAMALYRQAEGRTKGNDTAAYEGIASIAEAQGDYATAIKYYEKAEKVYAKMETSSPKWAWIHMHIEELKAKNAK